MKNDKKCSNCNGTGRVEHKFVRRGILCDIEYDFSYTKICDECGGTGSIPIKKIK